jgi:hypothetical protein
MVFRQGFCLYRISDLINKKRFFTVQEIYRGKSAGLNVADNFFGSHRLSCSLLKPFKT